MVASVCPCVGCGCASPVLSVHSVNIRDRSGRFHVFFLKTRCVVAFLLIMLSLCFGQRLKVLLGARPNFHAGGVVGMGLMCRSGSFDDCACRDVRRHHRHIVRLSGRLGTYPFVRLCRPDGRGVLAPAFNAGCLGGGKRGIFLGVRCTAPTFFGLCSVGMVRNRVPSVGGRGQHAIFIMGGTTLGTLNCASVGNTKIVRRGRGETGTGTSLRPVITMMRSCFRKRLASKVGPAVCPIKTQFDNSLCRVTCAPNGGGRIVSFLHGLRCGICKDRSFRCAFLRSSVGTVCARSHRATAVCSVFTNVTVVVSDLNLLKVSLFSVHRQCQRVTVHGIGNTDTGSLCQLLFHGCVAILVVTFIVTVPLTCCLVGACARSFTMETPIDVSVFVVSLLLMVVVSLNALTCRVRGTTCVGPARVVGARWFCGAARVYWNVVWG